MLFRSETKNILEQFTIQLWRTYSSHFDHHAISWEYEPDNIKAIWRREAASIYGQLQQAGWGNLKEQQKHVELLESENYAYQDKESELQVRIKELEKQNEQLRIGELVITTEQKQKEQIKAEARQQAFEEFAFKVNERLDKYDWQNSSNKVMCTKTVSTNKKRHPFSTVEELQKYKVSKQESSEANAIGLKSNSAGFICKNYEDKAK